MTREVIIKLISKVKKLADSGIAGEACAAKLKYKLLCDKYNLSDDDFKSLDESEYRFFSFRHSYDRQLLLNIICMILDQESFKWKEKNNLAIIRLNNSQFEEISAAFDIYKTEYDECLSYLTMAFLSKNKIGYIRKPSNNSNSMPNGVPDAPQKTTNSDIDMDRLIRFASAIDELIWLKSTSNKNLIVSSGSSSVL